MCISSTSSNFLAKVSGILLWALASNAHAAGPSKATLEKAKAFRSQGEAFLDAKPEQPHEAIQAFGNSYVLFQSPATLLLLGRALLDNRQYHEAAEFCQRYLREQPDSKDAYIATMCRSTAVSSGSGDSLVDTDGLSVTVLRDLSLADVHMLLGNFGLAEKFAEQFLTEVPHSSKARLYAVHLLRRALAFQGKSDPFQRQPRPRWRKAFGILAITAGLGIIGWGGGVLAYNGICADPKCGTHYNTSLYGGLLLGFGLTTLATGAIHLAWPGRPPERQVLRLGPSSYNPALAIDY